MTGCRLPRGVTGGGKDEVAKLISRLIAPSSGRIAIDDRSLDGIPEAVLGRRMSYVGTNAHVFSGTVFDNVVYGLKHRPMEEPVYDSEQARERTREVREAKVSGTIADDLEAYGAFRLQVDAKALGPKLGKQMKDVLAATRSGDWSLDGASAKAGGGDGADGASGDASWPTRPRQPLRAAPRNAETRRARCMVLDHRLGCSRCDHSPAA